MSSQKKATANCHLGSGCHRRSLFQAQVMKSNSTSAVLETRNTTDRFNYISMEGLCADCDGCLDVFQQNLNDLLFGASYCGHVTCVKALTAAGADVNGASLRGNTALTKAAEGGSEECLNILIEAGADVNLISKNGDTALIKGAKNGNSECVKMLIKAGTDINATNGLNKSALHYASEKDFDVCLKLLIEGGGDIWI